MSERVDFSTKHIAYSAYVALLRDGEQFKDRDWTKAEKYHRHAINLAADLRDAFTEIERLRQEIKTLEGK